MKYTVIKSALDESDPMVSIPFKRIVNEYNNIEDARKALRKSRREQEEYLEKEQHAPYMVLVEEDCVSITCGQTTIEFVIIDENNDQVSIF